ncbi:MAG: hypothetical protein ACLQAH_11955 [Limisphaerales bacterium]
MLPRRQNPATEHRRPTSFRVRPDFVFRQVRLALFVAGCFWHATKPANNRAFWQKKLAGNKTRDRLVNHALRRAGWRVLRIWECELPRQKSGARSQNPEWNKLLQQIRRALG